MLKDLKRETDNNTMTGGGFNITHYTVRPDMEPTGLTWHVRAGGPDLSIHKSFSWKQKTYSSPGHKKHSPG